MIFFKKKEKEKLRAEKGSREKGRISAPTAKKPHTTRSINLNKTR